MTMRVHEVLNESIKRVTVWSGVTIPVLHNPTRAQFEAFVEKHRAIRGLVSYNDRDIWLWDAAAAVHTNIIQQLGLEHVDCVAYMDGRWTGPILDDYAYRAPIQRLTPQKAPVNDIDAKELLKMLSSETENT